MTGEDMQILIAAGDTPQAMNLVTQLVTGLSADITLVDSIEDARELLLAGGVDVILADQCLTDGSGLDLLRDETVLNLPFILLGGRPQADRILTAMRLGAADVFVDPIDPAHLIEVVRGLVQQRRRSEHEAVRAERLRLLSSRLLKDRRELRKRVDLICRDLVTAYRRLAEKVVASTDDAVTVQSGLTKKSR